jgi:hypothetical protein
MPAADNLFDPARYADVRQPLLKASTVARDDFTDVAERYYECLRVTNGEDNVIAESQQVGLSQRLNRPGRYTEHELLVQAPINHVLNRGEGGRLSIQVHSSYTPRYRCCSASSARKDSESPVHTTWPFSMM